MINAPQIALALLSLASLASAQVKFTDIRPSTGITFQQDSTQTEEKYYLETMGTGVAWIDYDQDGLMDLFFVQSAATDIYKPPHPLRCALYHNNGDGTFTDVTEKAGVGGEVEAVEEPDQGVEPVGQEAEPEQEEEDRRDDQDARNDGEAGEVE